MVVGMFHRIASRLHRRGRCYRPQPKMRGLQPKLRLDLQYWRTSRCFFGGNPRQY